MTAINKYNTSIPAGEEKEYLTRMNDLSLMFSFSNLNDIHQVRGKKTPLTEAMATNNLGAVQLLLGIDPTIARSEMISFALNACLSRKEGKEIFEQVIIHTDVVGDGSIRNCIVNYVKRAVFGVEEGLLSRLLISKDGFTELFKEQLLIASIVRGEKRVIEFLINWGCSLNSKELFLSIDIEKEGAYDIVILLLNKGGEIRRKKEIFHLMSIKDPRLNRLLIDAAKGIEKENILEMMLEFSIENSDVEMAKAIIEAGVDLKSDYYSEPILMKTVLEDIGEGLVEIMLKNGADPNIVDVVGSSPLHYSLIEEEIEALIAHGADVNIINEEGAVPLVQAIFNFHHRKVDILLSNGANPDIMFKGQSLLSLYIQETIRSILDEDLSLKNIRRLATERTINHRDDRGKSPLIYAEELSTRIGKVDKLIPLLEKLGAKE